MGIVIAVQHGWAGWHGWVVCFGWAVSPGREAQAIALGGLSLCYGSAMLQTDLQRGRRKNRGRGG